MLDWLPDLVVAFAGGTGTAGMGFALARAAGVPVIEPRSIAVGCRALSEQRTLIGCAPISGNDPFATPRRELSLDTARLSP
jgi:hypothetical protein